MTVNRVDTESISVAESADNSIILSVFVPFSESSVSHKQFS